MTGLRPSIVRGKVDAMGACNQLRHWRIALTEGRRPSSAEQILADQLQLEESQLKKLLPLIYDAGQERTFSDRCVSVVDVLRLTEAMEPHPRSCARAAIDRFLDRRQPRLAREFHHLVKEIWNMDKFATVDTQKQAVSRCCLLLLNSVHIARLAKQAQRDPQDFIYLEQLSLRVLNILVSKTSLIAEITASRLKTQIRKLNLELNHYFNLMRHWSSGRSADSQSVAQLRIRLQEFLTIRTYWSHVVTTLPKAESLNVEIQAFEGRLPELVTLFGKIQIPDARAESDSSAKRKSSEESKR
jgi:hypothetical protein